MKRCIQRLLVAYVCMTAMLVQATTIHTTNKWAWAPSSGWINCRTDEENGAIIGDYVCSGYFYSPSYGWIHLGDGSPTNGIRYTQKSGDYGVNHDGEGNLRGYAWGASAGWISFENTGAPTVDLVTGKFTGHAWSASMGWISFDNLQGYLQTTTFDRGADTTGSGLPDAWEWLYGGTNLFSASGDYDNDGFTDYEEYIAGTNPTNDTDFLHISELVLEDANTMKISFPAVPTRVYRLRQTDSLTNAWSDSGHDWQTADESGTTTWTVSTTENAARYYRVQVALPGP